MFEYGLTKGKVVVVALLTVAVLTAGLVISSMSNQNSYAAENDTVERKTLTVSATAKVETEPDIAYVSFGVVTENKDAKTAQQENANKMSDVIQAIKDAGIEEKDIKTNNYSIQPKYNYIKESGESEIIGYRVSNTVDVTIRELDKSGEILDLASDAGINISNNIRFGLSENEQYYQEALKKAAKVAKERAEAIAEELGLKLKSPVKITQSGGVTPVYGYAKAEAAMDGARSTPIQAGTMEVSASINIVYEY